jgi:hypothetical protein
MTNIVPKLSSNLSKIWTKVINIEQSLFPQLKKRRGRPKKGETREPIKPKFLTQQNEMKTVEEMLTLVSKDCAVGVKENSKGNREVWIGGKLHISAVDAELFKKKENIPKLTNQRMNYGVKIGFLRKICKFVVKCSYKIG